MAFTDSRVFTSCQWQPRRSRRDIEDLWKRYSTVSDTLAV